MSATPIADMVEAMLARGIAAEVIVLAVRTAEAGAITLPVTLPATLPPPLPKERSRKAVNQARYRENLKAKQGAAVAMAGAPQAATQPATLPVTRGNAVADAPLSKDSEVVIEEGLSKEESKKEVVEPQSSEPRAKAKRGTRLPDDWQPSGADVAYATSRGLRLIEIEIEATKFRNYWTNRTDRQASKPRWDRAWQNWILNVKGSRSNGQDRSVVAAADRLNAKLAEFAEPDLLSGVRGQARAPDVRLLPAGRSG